MIFLPQKKEKENLINNMWQNIHFIPVFCEISQEKIKACPKLFF